MSFLPVAVLSSWIMDHNLGWGKGQKLMGEEIKFIEK